MSSEEKKSKLKINYIAIIGVLFIIFIIVFLCRNNSKKSKLVLDDFQKKAIFSYIENDILDLKTLNKYAGNVDDLQLFQANLKIALDNYFAENATEEVATSVILERVDSKYVPETVDFHGIQVSDYQYEPERDVFVKSPGYNAGLANVEATVNSFDSSDQKVVITSIDKISNNNYKVLFNIVNSMSDNSVISSGDATLSFENDNIKIDSCNVNQ